MLKIQEFLKSKNITIIRFAKDLGLSRNTTMSYISIYEKGGTIPKATYKYIFDFLFTDTNKFDFNYFCITHHINRLSFFTNDELYIIHRVLIEASPNIILDDENKLAKKLLNEISEEYSNRIYNK